MKGWKTIKSKVAYKCKYFKVVEDDFVTPRGKNYRYYLLKRNDYVIVIAQEGDYFYLTEQYRYTTKSRLLEVVAGAIEKGETPLEAAKKELKEETGIKAKKFRKLGWSYPYYGVTNQKAYIFLATDLKFGKQELKGLEKDSGIKVRKLKISEVAKLIDSGKIKDADTITAFGLFMVKFKNVNS